MSLKDLIKQAYCRLHDDILFKRDTRFYGTSMRSYADFDTYITHAAFHKIKGLPLPAVLGRGGTPPWFASIRGAQKIANRNRMNIDHGFWNTLTASIPEALFKNSDCLVKVGFVGNERIGTGTVSWLNTEIRSVATIDRNCRTNVDGYTLESLGAEDRRALDYWAGVIHAESENSSGAKSMPNAILKAFEADPHHPQYRENIFMTGALLNGIPIALVEFRKGSSEKLYRITQVSIDLAATRNSKRLARHVVRKYERYMMKLNQKRQDLCLDFVGSIESDAAVMGHAVFKMLVSDKIDKLRNLEPDTYNGLFKKVSRYQYPAFRQAEQVSAAAVIREGLMRVKKRLQRYVQTDS